MKGIYILFGLSMLLNFLLVMALKEKYGITHCEYDVTIFDVPHGRNYGVYYDHYAGSVDCRESYFMNDKHYKLTGRLYEGYHEIK